MPKIMFTLAEPRVLVLAVLCTTITGYFISLPKKTRDLRFLIGAFCCWAVHFWVALCREAIYPLSEWFALAQLSIGLTGLILFIGFAYNFRVSRYSRDFRIGLIGASALVVMCCSVLFFQIATHRAVGWSLGSGTAVVVFLCGEGVFVRRWIESKNSLVARPYRSFALVFLLSVTAVGVYFLRDIGAFPVELASVLASILYLSNLVCFVLVYVNHAPVATTFRVKIVGASLFAVLAVVTAMWTAVGPTVDDGAIPAHDVGANRAAGKGLVRLPLKGRQLDAQEKVIRCNYCIIGSTLFVVIFFPAFFRVSMVAPLNTLLKAVDKVDAGRRDIQLVPSFNDEIGRLTVSFNRMTESLKAAEDDLRCYAESLELKVKERTAELARKNEENERLLLNILPVSIADRLRNGEAIIADACSAVTILFADIVGFTALSTRIPADDLVSLLSGLVSDFDRLAQEHGVEKIKTIGDSYMAAAGIPDAREDHAEAAVRLGIAMLAAASNHSAFAGKSLQLRIGIHSGPVIAGVIGTHKFAYDLWGDTVNTASRMESHGQPGRIQVTEATYRLLREEFRFEPRGQVDVKGKGLMSTYFLGMEYHGFTEDGELNPGSPA